MRVLFSFLFSFFLSYFSYNASYWNVNLSSSAPRPTEDSLHLYNNQLDDPQKVTILGEFRTPFSNNSTFTAKSRPIVHLSTFRDIQYLGR